MTKCLHTDPCPLGDGATLEGQGPGPPLQSGLAERTELIHMLTKVSGPRHANSLYSLEPGFQKCQNLALTRYP